MERSTPPQALKNSLADWFVIDVRRQTDLDTSSEQLPGASWHDPAKVTQWVTQLPKDKSIVLYCVRGGSVSNTVVDALRAKGLQACFIEGGIEGWKAAGGPTVSK